MVKIKQYKTEHIYNFYNTSALVSFPLNIENISISTENLV